MSEMHGFVNCPKIVTLIKVIESSGFEQWELKNTQLLA